MTSNLQRLLIGFVVVTVLLTGVIYITEIPLSTKFGLLSDQIGLITNTIRFKVDNNTRNSRKTLQQYFRDLLKAPSLPSCTSEIITAYMETKGGFPDKGQWYDTQKKFPGPRYKSEICSLPVLNLTSLPLLNYLHSHPNTSSIVLFGDSRGRRFKDALIRHLTLQQIGYSCKGLKSGPKGVIRWNADYFVDSSRNISGGDLVSTARTCVTCVSTLLGCTLNKKKSSAINSTLPQTLRIEYIAMIIGDTTGILPSKDKCKKSTTSALCKVKTMQEFLFKVYFQNRMPDAFIHFSSFAHDVAHKTVGFKVTLRNFVNLVKESVPMSTKYMFVTSAPTVIAKLPKSHISHKLYENGIDYNEKIKLFNHLLYEAVHAIRSGENEIGAIGKGAGGGPRENFRAWFDLYYLGSPARTFWMKGGDGMHFESVWYDTILEYLFYAL